MIKHIVIHYLDSMPCMYVNVNESRQICRLCFDMTDKLLTRTLSEITNQNICFQNFIVWESNFLDRSAHKGGRELVWTPAHLGPLGPKEIDRLLVPPGKSLYTNFKHD